MRRLYHTLIIITNLFIIAGVVRHWNSMSHQSDKMQASATRFGFCNEQEKRQPEDRQTQESDRRSDSSR